MNVSGEGKVGKSVLKSTKLVRHHVIPKEILKQLPDDVYKIVKGKKGAPNRWRIPEDLHNWLHSGGGRGGKYNKFWRAELIELRKRIEKIENATPDDIFDIRDRAVEKFGLGEYKPY